jgi:hypothetical protein
MSDLPGETTTTEQPTSEDSTDTHKTDFWAVATTVAIVLYFVWRLFNTIDNDIVRAHVLRMFVRLFARTARYMGEQALLAEQLYYDTVRVMH